MKIDAKSARERLDYDPLTGLSVKGKHKSLGSFDSAEEAHEAYVAAKRILHAGNTL